MESDVVAAAAIFPTSIRNIMIGIAGAESDFTLARGDLIGSTYTVNGVSGTIPYSQWNCGGYTSFGPWPVNLPANHYLIQRLTGISDPCGQSEWLLNYDNSAQAALAVYKSAGLGAWTTYRIGAYLKYMPQTSTQASAPTTTQTTTPTPTGAAVNDIITTAGAASAAPGILPFLGIAAVAILLGGIEGELV